MHAQPGWGSLLAWPALLSCPVPARLVLCTVLLSILAHPYPPLGGWQASRHLPSAASRIVAGIGDLWASGVVVFRCVMCLRVWSSFPLIPLLVTCVCVGICPRRVHLREIVSVCGDVLVCVDVSFRGMVVNKGVVVALWGAVVRGVCLKIWPAVSRHRQRGVLYKRQVMSQLGCTAGTVVGPFLGMQPVFGCGLVGM